jgi:hypothetical protein
MNYAFSLAACAVLICCTVFSGCTSPTQSAISPPETTVAPLPTTLTTVTTPIATPDPVVTLPAELFVDLQISKDRTNNQIHLLFNGGKGEDYVQTVRMRVTRSDGIVSDQYMADGKKPRRGDELVIGGTRGSDRCEVYVFTANKVYKIIDQPLISLR